MLPAFRCGVLANELAEDRNLLNESKYLSKREGRAFSPAAENARAPHSRCDDGMNILGFFIEFTLTA
jgi:hypothetical protein